jgi:hypothetical protein
MMRIFRLITTLALIAILAVPFAAGMLPIGQASALSGSQFDPGHIIDDVVFYNSATMSTTAIQDFLNAKVPTCDTNGTQNKSYYYTPATGEVNNADSKSDGDQWVTTSRATYGARYDKYYGTTIAAAPYTCLKSYKQNTPTKNAESGICGYLPAYSNRTAAQIITDVSAACGINPEVLIVLLQKEQGLVTDVWPWYNEYQKATGFACPDTSGCNTAYYGFFNQVYSAARQFKRYQADPTNWNYVAGQSNKIYYSPVTSTCPNPPYSWVTIQNQATAGLYDYTPYQPNKAALDNLYGTGDGCSAYGNRNFWRYFNDWFGSPTSTLFKISGNDTVYLNWGDTYYPIPSPAVLRAWGLGKYNVTTVSSSSLSASTQGPALSRVAKFGSDATVYLLDNGSYHAIPSWAMLNRYGLGSGDNVNYADSNLLNILQPSGSLTSLARAPSGAIYYVDGGKKHVFPDGKTFSTLGPSVTGDSSLRYNNFSDEFISTVSDGSPMIMDGSIVKAYDAAAIYLYDQGKLWLFSPDSWRAWGKQLDYGNFMASNLTQLPVGGNAPLLITDGTYQYLVSANHKYTVDTAMLSTWGLTTSQFQGVSASTISRVTTGGKLTNLFRLPSGAVSVVIAGKRLTVPSVSDFNGLGYQWSTVRAADDSILSIVPSDGSLAFAPGSLIRLPSGAVSWIDQDLTKHIIPSLDTFNAYGFSWSKVRNYGNSALNGYTSDTLQTLFKDGNGAYWLADLGQRHAISQTAYGASQYNFATRESSTLSSQLIAKISNGPALTNFIQGHHATVYKIVDGQKRPFSSQTSFYAQGGQWSLVTPVSDKFLATLPTGAAY